VTETKTRHRGARSTTVQPNARAKTAHGNGAPKRPERKTTKGTAREDLEGQKANRKRLWEKERNKQGILTAKIKKMSN